MKNNMIRNIQKEVFNPYLPSWEYIPDGEPHVFGDRVYIYGSHDYFNGHVFCLGDYVCWSAPIDDFSNFRYEGVIYPKTKDPLNTEGKMCLYAPDVTKGPDNRYYIYYVLDHVSVVSVAVSDTPAGEYSFYGYVKYEDGVLLGDKEGDEPQFDPAVITMGDVTYLYTGFCGPNDRLRSGAMVTQLDKDMLTIKKKPQIMVPSAVYAENTSFEGHAFFEAPSIRKVEDSYYFVYSSQVMHELCYATSIYPDRDFTYGGVIVSNCDLHIDTYKSADMPTAYGANNHGGIEKIGSDWFVFYHRHTNGSWYSRQGCAEKIVISKDGKINQVEMTSAGLNQGPLVANKEFPAYIACNLFTDKPNVYVGNENCPRITQDGKDGDENSGYIANMKNSATAGFKYFDCKNIKKFALRVRGYADGKFEIRTKIDQEALATIVVKNSNVWERYETELELKDGVYSLYITYVGNGTASLQSFEWITMSVIAKNPILPGFYPDPSICAAGDDFYLVNSTFSYFPGLPILHSKDLANWEQIGNALDRVSQLPLVKSGHSNGLYAPTIRFNDGIFYLICTNVSYRGNFIVTATDPRGPWSEPFYLDGADGIDPSLFFDEDGKCYYIGTHPNPDGVKYNGDWFIWIQEIDIQKMQLVGEKKDVWNGSMKNVIWPEGPHIYKMNGYYYILHAEGGTGPDHCIAVCRSKNIWGPYENFPKNPIITHRHLGKAYPIQYVGHGDLVETKAGEWFMVMLAVRPLMGYTTMGRETFLVKVTWEEDWPVVNAGVGLLTDEVKINLDPWDPKTDQASYTYQTNGKTAYPNGNKAYDFTKIKEVGDEFLMLRNPSKDMYMLSDEGLGLKFGLDLLKEEGNPSFLAIRQQHHKFITNAYFQDMELEDGEAMGLVLMQSNEYHLRLEITKDSISTILCQAKEDSVLKSVSMQALKIDNHEICLQMKIDGLTAKVFVGEKEEICLSECSISNLSTEIAGGFVGCTIGVYATSSNKNAVEINKENQHRARVLKFSYYGKLGL